MPVTQVSATNSSLPVSGTAGPRPAQAADIKLLAEAMGAGTVQPPADAAAMAEFDRKFREDILQKMIRDGNDRFHKKVFSGS